MKTQNNKIKTATSIVTALLIGLVLMTPTAIVPNVSADTNQVSKICRDQSEKTIHDTIKQIDYSKAKSIVTSASEFKTMANGYNPTFESLYTTWHINKVDCSLTWNDTHVVYQIKDSGDKMKNLDFSLDPHLTKVNNVTEYQPVYNSFPVTGTSPTWAGYEFAGNSANTTSVLEAEAQYTQPSVSKPSGFSCLSGAECRMSMWAGLENAWDGTNQNLAQTGTEGIVTCSGSCSSSYNMWWELLPATETVCTSVTVNSGDSITADVKNDILNSGGNANYYDFYSVDNTNGNVCAPGAQYYPQLNSPTVAAFVNEHSSCGSSCTYPLAQFNTSTIAGWMYYSSSLKDISNPYSSGNYVAITMKNSGTTNVSINSVGGTGSFTSTYQSSSGT
jgi:hypothetical protein